MKVKHILKDIKGKTITEAINNLKEIESLEESNKELLEGLISTQKKLEEWLES